MKKTGKRRLVKGFICLPAIWAPCFPRLSDRVAIEANRPKNNVTPRSGTRLSSCIWEKPILLSRLSAPLTSVPKTGACHPRLPFQDTPENRFWKICAMLPTDTPPSVMTDDAMEKILEYPQSAAIVERCAPKTIDVYQ